MSLISELGLVDPIVVNLLRKNTQISKKGSHKSKGDNTSKSSRKNTRRRPTLRCIALTVLGAIRLARGVPGNRKATIWNKRITSIDDSCWYVVDGIGRMRMSSIYLASSIAQDRNTRSSSSSSSKSNGNVPPSSPMRTSPDVSRSLSSLVSLFSTPNVGGFITGTNASSSSSSSLHDDDLLQAASENIVRQNNNEKKQEQKERTLGSATTAEILAALINDRENINAGGNQSEIIYKQQDTSYQIVLIRRAMLKLIDGYISATNRAKNSEKTLQKTAFLLQNATNECSDIRNQRVKLQHRCEAYEARLRTFVIEECDIVEGNESTILNDDNNDGNNHDNDDTFNQTLSKYSEHKYIRLSSTLYNDIRRDRDQWKDSYQKLIHTSENKINAFQSEIHSLIFKLDQCTKELKECQNKLMADEKEHNDRYKSIKLQYKKKVNECKDQQNILSELSENLVNTKECYVKEKNAREHLSTELTNLRIEHRKAFMRWKERQKNLTENNNKQKNQLLDRTQILEEQILKLEDKIRWCHARDENKKRSFMLEKKKLEEEIERGRERERYLVSREREQVMAMGNNDKNHKIVRRTKKGITRMKSKKEKQIENDDDDDDLNTTSEIAESFHAEHLRLSTLSKLKLMAAEKALLAKVEVALKDGSENENENENDTTEDGKEDFKVSEETRVKKVTSKSRSKIVTKKGKGIKPATSSRRKGVVKKSKLKKVIKIDKSGALKKNKTGMSTSLVSRKKDAAAPMVTTVPLYLSSEEEDDESLRSAGLDEMKAYIDRIDRRLFDRYGTPKRSKSYSDL
jgi:hypothetical protein